MLLQNAAPSLSFFYCYMHDLYKYGIQPKVYHLSIPFE